MQLKMEVKLKKKQNKIIKPRLHWYKGKLIEKISDNNKKKKARVNQKIELKKELINKIY